MSRQFNKAKFSRRTMKVYYHQYPEAKKPHPVIRLGGIYLSDLDFQIGDEIEVVAEPGRIVITKT